MKTLITIGIFAALTMTGILDAQAELLPREFFAEDTPETFDAYPGWDWDDRDFDFGLFSITGWYDTVAYYMPIAAPVELPTIGGDNVTISFHPPVSAAGFDLGAANFGETNITFIGRDDAGAEMELATFAITDLMADGSGPSGYQGFVGFRDDNGYEIHEVTVGPIDLYLDNVVVAEEVVATRSATLSSVKSLYR